jgi:hypothetical protein
MSGHSHVDEYGSGAWSEVSERLKQRGHEALAPTLAGHGKGVDKNVTHAQCTRSVVDFIVRNSFGGTVICKVVEAIPERIHRLVFYADLVLRDGESVYDAAPPEQRAAMDQLVVASSDGTLMLPFDLWRDGYRPSSIVST